MVLTAKLLSSVNLVVLLPSQKLMLSAPVHVRQVLPASLAGRDRTRTMTLQAAENPADLCLHRIFESSNGLVTLSCLLQTSSADAQNFGGLSDLAF